VTDYLLLIVLLRMSLQKYNAFYHEEGIRFSHLPLHTSHKLQPADIMLFSYLKAYYREEVKRLYHGGCHGTNQETRRLNCYSIKRKEATKSHKSSTIYKSGSCDLCGARACGEGLEPEQDQVGAKPELGWS
jgi:hypothetical protein